MGLTENSISPAIEKHYKVVGVKPGIVAVKGREYDLRTISLEEADLLHAKGNFPYLQKLDQEPVVVPPKKEK